MTQVQGAFDWLRRQPGVIGVIALTFAVAFAMVWGVAPVQADTVATTPTLVAPAASATPTPAPTGSIRPRAQAPGVGDQCATPEANPGYSATCPLQLKLVAAATPAGDTGYRVGDPIKIEIHVLNSQSTLRKINGVSAHVDFDKTQVQLLGVNATSTPVAISTPNAGSTPLDGGIIKKDATAIDAVTGLTILKNYYSEASTTGKIDYEFGITGAANAVTIPATNGDIIIGYFWVRILLNPATDGTYTLTLRAQNLASSGDDQYRNSIIADGETGDGVGKNIMSQATSAPLTVKKTTVALALAVGTPVDRSVNRVGDTVPVQLTLANSAAMFVRNATSLDAAISFETAKFTLVQATPGPDSKVKVAANTDGATVAKIVDSGFALAAATAIATGSNYSESNGTGTVTLKIDGTALSYSGTAATKTFAIIYLRPRFNDSTVQNLTIVSGSLIGIRNANAIGFQLDVTATATTPVPLTVTTAALSMVPTLPSPIRVGDTIPVDIKITPTEAKYINHLETKITFSSLDYQLVTTASSNTAVSGAAVTLSATALAAASAGGTGGANAYAISTNTGTITLVIDGTPAIASGTAPVLIGTIYVRPLKKTGSGLAYAFTSTVGDHKAGEGLAASLDFQVAVTTATPPAISPVIGTLGVSLEMRSPTAASPELSANIVPWVSSTSATPTFDVVDGRFLDVKVMVNANTTVSGDARKVDRFVIGLTFDALQVELVNTTGAVNAEFVVLSASPVVTGTVTATTTSATLTLASASLLDTSTEVARLRFQIKRPAVAAAPVVMTVANTTTLRQATGLFVTDNYANIVSGSRGEFDTTSTATRLRPASLQISTYLQGRSAGNLAPRFVQNIGIELRASGGSAVGRHLTVTTTPASVRGCSSSCDTAMKYDKSSKKASSGANAEFAQDATTNVGTAEPLADLEPGTYDVYLKGETAVAVLVTGVVFGEGSPKTISGLVFREGDLSGDNKVDTTDFGTFSSSYNVAAPTTSATARSAAEKADFNRSGYVDILDFSLLANNFNSAGVLDTIAASGSTVTVSRLRPSSASPNASLTVATGSPTANGLLPVTVEVAPGSRAVDGVQVVLQTAPGVTLVDAAGNTASDETAFTSTGALPSPLLQAWDAVRGLLNLGLGVNVGTTGLSTTTSLGTIYVKVPTGFAGAPLSILPRDGNFATIIAGAGDDLSTVIDAPAPATAIVVSSDTPIAASAPRASAPAVRTGTAPVVAAPVRAPMSPALTEDVDRGVIALTIPGRMTPVELMTGLATTVPDAYCPTVRHNTYIRLEDEGIAGATFGVEAGGVLAWVTPDQAGCVDWTAIASDGLTFTKETIMQFELARAVPGALLWVLSGDRTGELYEVDPQGTAAYITGENFAANQDHFTAVWANVIPVSSGQINGLASRGSVRR